MSRLESANYINFVFITLATAAGSWLGTALVRRLAWRYGWIAPSRDDRWHKIPTALHGGLGFYPTFLVGTLLVLVFYIQEPWWRWGAFEGIPVAVRLALALVAGSLTMFIFGILDDIKQFRPATKLLCQLIAASIFTFAGGIFHLTNIYVFDLLITYFWFIGITNAINMLDNMDGLCSGVAILAGATLVIMGGYTSSFGSEGVLIVPIGLALIGSLFGFWLHNRTPASIFMGDSGSLFIGYVLAALAVPNALNGFMGIKTAGTLLGPVLVLLIPATILAIPIFDTTFVTLTRTFKAQRAFDGGQDHSSHRLVGLGISEKRAVWIMYSLAAFGGCIAILMQRFSNLSLPLFGFFSLVLVLTGVYLGHVKVQVAKPGQRPPAWTPIVSELLYKRRAAEVILDTILIVISFFGAYLLRFEGELTGTVQHAMVRSLPLVVASCLAIFALSGIYRGQWNLISVSDIPRYALSVAGGTALSLAVVTLVTRFGAGLSRSAYIIFSLLLFFALVGARLSFRLLDSFFHLQRSKTSGSDQNRVLIYGAGSVGKMLYEIVTRKPDMKGYITVDTPEDFTIVGFIDDDPKKAGRQLCGLPVRNQKQWLTLEWGKAPEIWVSSRHVDNKLACELANHWNGEAIVRRLKIQMENIENSQVTALLKPLSTGEKGI